MSDRIRSAYEFSQSFYDKILTRQSLLAKAYMKLFWSGTDDNEVARRLLSWIPDEFSGTLLDVPVGTAVFTTSKWLALKQAQITCLDYSEDMLAQARARLDAAQHITCMQGDVGNLPMQDNSFDIVVSMNGFHAFPDKNAAFREIRRVLKPNGLFIACFYIREKSSITDCLVRQILTRKGWFTPPFYNEKELRNILDLQYRQTEFHVDGSIALFKCTK